jgi:hypothetical protein
MATVLRRLYVVAALVASTGAKLPAAEIPIWKPQTDLNSGSYKGIATITVSEETLAIGEEFDVDVRFNCAGGLYFYNPFFNSLIPAPAKLAIFDASKAYVGDLLRRTGGSAARPGLSNWTVIPGNSYVGTKLRFKCGHVPGRFDTIGNELPAGTYYLQMIYNGRFASAPPIRDLETEISGESLAHWEKVFDSKDLFRSNVVTITLGRD